jgi:hypothetical protein
MEQKDYLILAAIVVLLAAVFGYFFLFSKKSDFKVPVMDGTNVFVGLNKINDPRPAMVYVHNGCPCLGQPMGQTFQNLATEMQAYGSFYQIKANPAKIQASFSPPYVAFFIGGQLITGFQAGSLSDFQTFFLKMVGTVTGNTKVSGSVPTPGAVTPGAVTPGAVTPGVVTPGAVTPGSGPIANIINGILGGGTTPGTAPGPISDLLKGITGGNINDSGILAGVVKGIAPIANTALTNLTTADLRNIITTATSFDPSGISGTVVGFIPDSAIEMARNFLIGLTRAQSLYIGI